jgi:hypothetical protein
VKVEAEGTLDANGNIAATKVSFRDSLRLQGAVTPASVVKIEASNTTGTFKMFDGAITVHVSDATRFDDALDLSVLTTQSVEVRGYPSASGTTDIVATRIKLASSSGGHPDRVFIQGPVTATNATAKTIAILGLTIDVSAAQLKGRDETTIVAGDFFSNVSVGTVVKARGTFSSGTLKADEVELEDDK